MPETTMVLGLGNTIMADDGVGPKVVTLLQEQGGVPEGVELLDGGTLGLDLLPRLEGVGRLIIVDAIEAGLPVGSLIRLTGEEVPLALETKLSPHQMGLKDLLAVLRLVGQLPPEIILIGIQPAHIDMDTELSPEVAARLTELMALVRQELAATGAAVGA